jgi:preprotein translocase subunit SecE
MRRRRADRTLMVAGVVTIALGTLFLLDQLDVIDIRFGYTMPVLLAAIGAVLLTAGLDQGRR